MKKKKKKNLANFVLSHALFFFCCCCCCYFCPQKTKDDTTYDTVFQTTQGDTLILRVNVPNYETFCPGMVLSGVKVKHPWIESTRGTKVTGYSAIQSESSWKQSGLLLGAAVHEVVKHLQLNPPEILEITDKGLLSLNKGRRSGKKSKSPIRKMVSKPTSTKQDAPPDYDIFVAGSGNNDNFNPGPAPEMTMPTVPGRFPETEAMEREEIDQKLDDEAEFLAFVHGLPIYQEIQTLSTKYYPKNVELAEQNLEKESKLKGLYKEVCDLQEQLQEKLKTFQTLEKEQMSLCAPPDEKKIMKKLKRANKEAFEASEDYANEWVEDGGDSVKDFVTHFMKLRKVHHMRAAKMEIIANTKASI